METRPATEEDVPAILEISRTTPWDKEKYLRRQVTLGHVLVAVIDSTVVGFVAWNHEFFSLACIYLIAVAPNYRKQGIATRLFDVVEAACKGERLFSSTNLSDTRMQRFFELRGYRRSGELDIDPGNPEVFFQLDPRT